MNPHLVLLLCSVFSIPLPTESAKILGIFPILSKSHHSINQPIVKGLAAKGHEVTIISHFKSADVVPNYTEILFPEGIQDFVDTISVEDGFKYSGFWNMVAFIVALEKSFCDNVFGLEYIQQLMRNSNETTIDLIIAEVYHSRCFHLLAHRLKVPLIIVLPMNQNPGSDFLIGNPIYPSVIPMDEFTTKMDFLQRLENTIGYIIISGFHHYAYNKDMERYAREVFNMDLPSNEELNKRTAMVFYNNHLSFISRAMSPNAINIAGIHITEPKKLPKDIEEFIEGATHGVILFSFGTTIKASSISSEKLKIIVDAFSAVPQRILWRVNELNIAEVPPNVKLCKWFPQRDILEHKNVIGFISHCGLQGTLEAIHTATPVIAIPFAFDQLQDANILVEKGAGVHVDYFTMDKNTLIGAINEIVTKPKYRENMQKLSEIFKDRPMSALDEALYWSEYVLRHQGASHLRTAAADMPFYQYLLLDVFIFLLSILVEHKNVIGFISHCGLQGTLEAIHTATPVIAIPFAFDQFLDANILVEKGASVYVNYFTMDRNTLIDAINEIVAEPKYRENMQKLSKIFKDRPMSALDEALYWSEYVLRHQGAPHLRTAAADMPFYQYLLLDAFIFLLSILVGAVYICKFSYKILISLFCFRKLNKTKTQ